MGEGGIEGGNKGGTDRVSSLEVDVASMKIPGSRSSSLFSLTLSNC